MSWLALETGDAATWGGTVVTFGMACYAVAQSVGQRRDLRRQNELQAESSQLQRRQIETAERRTLVMEQILAQMTAPARPGAPAQAPAPAPAPPVPAPGWTGGAPRSGEPAAPWHDGPVPVQRQPAPGAPPAMPVGTGMPQSPVPPPAGEHAGDSGAAAAADEDADEFETADEFEPAGDFETADAFGTADEAGPADEFESGEGRQADPADVDARPDPAAWHRPGPAAPPFPPGRPQQSAPDDPYSAGRNVPPPQQQQPPAPPYMTPPPYMPAPAPAAPSSVPRSAPPAPPGVWRVERFGRHGFALRNTTSGTLTGVHISRENLPASARGVPEDSVVRAGETAEFLMAAERGRPLPDAILVSWHGGPGPAYVQVPRG